MHSIFYYFRIKIKIMEPEDTIDYNIRKTWYNITKLYNRTANEYMASMALGMIILNIDIMEGTPSTQLGPNMGMEATSLSRSLNKLEESGVIERKPDPNDKRRTVICLTPLGMDWRIVAKETVVNFNETIFSQFQKEEMDTFFTILKNINKIIDETK